MTSGNDRAHEVERLLTDPFDRLMGILERGEAQLDERRAELAEVRYALYELTAQRGVARPAQAGHGLEPLRAEMAAPMLRYLIEHTTDLSRVCTMVIDAGAGIEQENYRLNQDLLPRGASGNARSTRWTSWTPSRAGRWVHRSRRPARSSGSRCHRRASSRSSTSTRWSP